MGFSELLAMVDGSVRAVLGGPVTYAPSSGSPVVVTGIFDSAYRRVDFSLGPAGVESSGPAVFLTLTDLPSDPSVDVVSITVNGSTYSVAEAKPDGQGGVLLLLHIT